MIDDPSAAHAERLRTVPLFASLSEGSLARMAEVVTEFEARAGHVLVEHGAPGAGLFVIEEGSVVVERPGKEAVHLGPGEFVGEMALLLPDGLRTARVRAESPIRCLAISRRDFDRILQEDPQIAVAMLPVLARRLADAQS
jgi:CRP-like cAMP-binding protein